MKINESQIKSAIAKLLNINESERILDWFDVIEIININERYEKALKEIAEETGTPYADIANRALNG